MSTRNLLTLAAFLLGLSIGAFITAIWYSREPKAKKDTTPIAFDESEIYHPSIKKHEKANSN